MDGPIRILHVVVNMNRGGAETLIMNLYRNIDRSKVQFDFLTSKKGIFDSEIARLGGRIYRIPYVTEIGHIKYIKSLDYFFEAHKDYRIVHSHMDKMSGLVLQSAAKAGIPCRVSHSHNTNSEGGSIAKLYKWYAGNKINKSATHKIACSQKAANWLFRKKSNEAFILKNGIDCNKFEFSNETRLKVRNDLGIPDDTFVVGHVGRFNKQKNHHFLIDIFAESLKENHKSILLLIGEGSLLPAIKKKVDDLHLNDCVKFLGVRDDVHHLFQAFDVFVFPSFHEGLPVTLIEAQCAGLPCLISDTITSEVDMGLEMVKKLPINSINKWKASLKSVRCSVLRNYHAKTALKNNGYDINAAATQTQDLYLKMVR
ncbi:glycosyltransferase family 1 protein [Fictibacillus barbaricus]|uniref:Glycosyltransferase involved in cell wall biosynthesis n=1 Tax=Fictibacillus barbaricus TaxID=182136 RepID=A0ABU1U1M8_9BACL|nr:glycosyltransferase family 1 protein [Fictibacillus barbaricus]MDR7073372.1 glycosyltransferase involved in cell wall biosynthesis [Fictibacillus barbaricus]